MFKQMPLCAALMFLTFVSGASAQSPLLSPLMPRESNWLVDEPITRNLIVTGIRQLEPGGVPKEIRIDVLNHLGIEHAGPAGNLRSAAHRTRLQTQIGHDRAQRPLGTAW